MQLAFKPIRKWIVFLVLLLFFAGLALTPNIHGNRGLYAACDELDQTGCTPQQLAAMTSPSNTIVGGTDNDAGWFSGITKAFNYFSSGAFLISLTGILLAFAGWLLNSAIEYFIVDMGTYLGTKSTMGSAIIQGWTVIRDLVNLTFVFGLIYLAFMTIAKADTTKLKHGIANILIGALLINFSIFFGKAIIDIANVTAIEIYQQMLTIPGVKSGDTDTIDVGITGFFAERLGVRSLVNPVDLVQGNTNVERDFGSLSFGFSILVSLLLLIASFVFMVGAILIAIRFVVLAILLILSPIAFAFAFIPRMNTEEWSHMWWDKMVAQALFAPAYLLLLYMAMLVTNSDMLRQSATVVDFIQGKGARSIGAMMNFIIIIGFLVGSIIVAKKMGAAGSSFAMKWGGKFSFGAAAFVGRHTAGRLGNRWAESDTVRDRASRKGVVGFINRRVLDASRVAQKSSFDVRGVGPLSSKAKEYGVDAGAAHTGGFKQMSDDVKKREKEYSDSLGVVDDKDPRVAMFKQIQEDKEHDLERQQDELKRQKELLKKTKNNPNATQAQLDAAQKAVDDQDENVKKAKKAIETAKENVEREKHRRQLGSAVVEADINEATLSDSEFARTQADLENAKKDLKKATKQAAGATTKAARDAALKQMADLQETIKKQGEIAEQAISKRFRSKGWGGSEVGYAGVLESENIVTAAFVGRTPGMSHAAAKGIRDAKKSHKKEEKESPKAKPPAGGGGGAAHGAGGGGGGHHP